jgi:hypothetical protein
MSDESKYEEWYKQEENRQKRLSKRRANVHVGPTMGSIWLIGWIFSIGYLHMPFFWKGVLAFLIWPYYLGSALAH